MKQLLISLFLVVILAASQSAFAKDTKLGSLIISYNPGDAWQVVEKPTKINLNLLKGKESVLSGTITVNPVSSMEGIQTPMQALEKITENLKAINKKELLDKKISDAGADSGASGLFEGRKGEFGTMQHAFVIFIKGDQLVTISFFGYKDKFDANMKSVETLLDSIKLKQQK